MIPLIASRDTERAAHCRRYCEAASLAGEKSKRRRNALTAKNSEREGTADE